MIIYLFICILSFLFTWLEQYRGFKNGLKFSFILLFIFLAFRYDYGNDYPGYLYNFQNLQGIDDSSFYFRENEFGWLYLNFLFKQLFGNFGFVLMYAFIAAFTTYVFYRFIKIHIPKNYYLFSVVLFFLEPNNILVLSSGIRQSIAVAIFLLSFDFFVQRRYFIYLSLLIFASLFHTSVLIFVLLFFLNFVNWKIYVPYIIFILLILYLSLNNLNAIFDQVNFLVEASEFKYNEYIQGGRENRKYGLGFFLSIFLFLIIVVVNRKNNNEKVNTIAKFGIVALLLWILALSVQMSGRLLFYIFPIIVIGYSISLMKINKYPKIKYGLQLLIVTFYMYQNYLFWNDEAYGPYFATYKTIFSSPFF
jgi:transmembrane protein EpsG